MSPEDQIVNALSRWLAGHLDNRELREEIETVDANLRDPQAEAVEELLAELEAAAGRRRGDLEKTVRETLEALALG
jgi:hypothetical protein